MESSSGWEPRFKLLGRDRFRLSPTPLVLKAGVYIINLEFTHSPPPLHAQGKKWSNEEEKKGDYDVNYFIKGIYHIMAYKKNRNAGGRKNMKKEDREIA